MGSRKRETVAFINPYFPAKGTLSLVTKPSGIVKAKTVYGAEEGP